MSIHIYLLAIFTLGVQHSVAIYVHCHVILIYKDGFPIGLISLLKSQLETTPSVHLHQAQVNYKHSIERLQQSWPQRKQTCQLLIYVNNPACETRKEFDWLAICSTYKQKATQCYGRQTYILAIRSEHLPLNSTSHFCDDELYFLMPHHDLILRDKETFELVTKLRWPCTAIIKSKFRLDSHWFPSQSLLDDELDQLILYACSVYWGFSYGLDKHKFGFLHTGVNSSIGTQGRIRSDATLQAEESMIQVVNVLNQTQSPLKNNTQILYQGSQFLGYVTIRPESTAYSESYRTYTNMYLIRVDSLTFMTCAGSQYITFSAFVEPFSLDLRIAAVSTFLIIWIFLLVWFKRMKSRYEPLSFLISVLLEQAVGRCAKMNELHGFRCFLIAISIVFMVLTTLYRGEVTTNLLAPFPTTRLGSVKEALDRHFQFIQTIRRLPKNLKAETKFEQDPQNLTVKWEFFWSVYKTNPRVFFDVIANEAGGRDALDNASLVVSKLPKLIKSLTPVLYTESDPWYEILLRCQNEICLDARREFLDWLFGYSKMKRFGWEKLYLGDDEYLPIRKFWIIGPILFDRKGVLHRRAQVVLQGKTLHWFGVPQDVRREKIKILFADRKRAKLEALKLQSGLLLGMFIIYGATSSFALFVFSVEVML